MTSGLEDLVSGAPNQDIAQKILAAINALLHDDALLFEVDVNERSISHRLALHLTPQFPECDVDCEYNRNGHSPKRLQLEQPKIDADDTDGARVFPDIIVHNRNSDKNNLLVIEIKKSTSKIADEFDLKKLTAFRTELNYKYGLFLRFESSTSKPGILKAEWCRLASES